MSNQGEYEIGYLTGVEDQTQKFTFQSMSEGSEWLMEVSALKNVIRSITKKKDENGGRYRREDYVAWLDRVEVFRQRWTNPFVPLDVQSAVNDVQENLHIEQTVW